MNTKSSSKGQDIAGVPPAPAQVGSAAMVFCAQIEGDVLASEATDPEHRCVGDSLRAAARLVIRCDPAMLDDFPLQVGFANPERVRHAQELAQRLSLASVPKSP